MVASEPPVLAAEERAWNYWFVDGLTNLVVGLNTLLAACICSFPPRWPPKPLALVLWASGLICYGAVTVRYKEIVEWLKARTTYPRTGYVAPPTPDSSEAANLVTLSLATTGTPPEIQALRIQRRTTWTIIIALSTLAYFAFLVIHARWIWTVGGVLFSIAMTIARRSFQCSWILPVGFPILGLYITTFVPNNVGADYFFVGMGLLFVLDGGTTLIRYLLQNPRPKVPAE